MFWEIELAIARQLFSRNRSLLVVCKAAFSKAESTLDVVVSQHQTYHLAMEKTSNKATPSLNLVNLFPLKIFHYLFNLMTTFLLSYSSILGSSSTFARDFEVQSKQKDCSFEDSGKKKTASFEEEVDGDGCFLLGKDVNEIMRRLGCEKQGFLGGDEAQKRWGYNEVSRVFEEEVKMEEVREAFDVFDQDKDGFIDADELQRVLLALGFKQGAELNACANMITKYDDNGDGKIDFRDFVRLLS